MKTRPQDRVEPDLLKRLTGLATAAAEASGKELYHLEFRPSGSGGGLLRLFIDSPSGVTLEDCERVSRRMSAELEIEDPIAGRYTLEVSSPGIERPLVTEEHFRRVDGQMAEVTTVEAIDGSRRFVGRLHATDDGVIEISARDGRNLRVPLSGIARARLVLEGPPFPR